MVRKKETSSTSKVKDDSKYRSDAGFDSNTLLHNVDSDYGDHHHHHSDSQDDEDTALRRLISMRHDRMDVDHETKNSVEEEEEKPGVIKDNDSDVYAPSSSHQPSPPAGEHNVENEQERYDDDDDEHYDDDDMYEDSAVSFSSRQTGSGPFDPSGFFANRLLSMAAGDPLGLTNGSSGFLTRMIPILNALRNRDDPSVVMTGLEELADNLLISNEDSLSSYFRVEPFATELVNILRDPLFAEAPEVLLLATRNLCNLLEALPSSIYTIVSCGAVPALCEKLFEIQYIDLAEQALSTLYRISMEAPEEVLRKGGLAACLTYLDFFSSHVQRTALSTAANMCEKITSRTDFSMITDAMPILLNVLNSSDEKVCEMGCRCVCSIILSYSKNPEKLGKIASLDLVKKLISLLNPSLSSAAIQDIKCEILTAIDSLAASLDDIAAFLIEEKISDLLFQILTNHTPMFDSDDYIKQDNGAIIQELIHGDRNLIIASLSLIWNILPESDFISLTDDIIPEKKSFSGMYTFNRSQLPQNTLELLDTRKKRLLDIGTESLTHFCRSSVFLMIDLFSASVDKIVRHHVLACLVDIVSLLPADSLSSVLEHVDLTSLLASIIAQPEILWQLIGALEIGQILLIKLPNVYRPVFYRLGIISEVEKMTGSQDMSDAEGTTREISDGLESSHDISTEASHDNSREDSIQGNSTEDPIHEISHGNSTQDVLMTDEMDEEDEEVDDDEDEDEDEDEDVDVDDEEIDSENSSDDDINDEEINEEMEDEINEEMEDETDEIHNEIQSEIHNEIHEIHDLDESNLLKHRKSIKRRFLRHDHIKYDSLNLTKLLKQDAKLLIDIYSTGEMNSEAYEEAAARTLEKLQEIIDGLSRKDDISTYMNILSSIIDTTSSFEPMFVEVLDALLKVLTSGDIDENRQIFLKYFTRKSPSNDKEHVVFLLEKLHEILARSERYDVISVGSQSHSKSKATKMLARQIRIKLVHDGQGENELPSHFNSFVLSIHAIATFKSINDFLKSKVALSRLVNGNRHDRSGSFILDRIFNSDRSFSSALAALSSSSVDERQESNDSAHEDSTDDIHLDEHSEGSKREKSKSESKDDKWSFQFVIDGEVIPHDSTVLNVIYCHLMNQQTETRTESGTNERFPNEIWHDTFTVAYRKIEGKPLLSPVTEGREDLVNWNPWMDLPASLGNDEATSVSLRLLSVLFDMNSSLEHLKGMKLRANESLFISSKLTAKLNRQLNEPLIMASGIVPPWMVDITRLCPFLFPFNSRYAFLQSTSFGYSRSMNRWQNGGTINSNNRDNNRSRDDGRSQMGTLLRQKVRVSRDHILHSAVRVMELCGSSPNVLEVEFFDEEGTGLGPTLEFYSLVSKELSMKQYKLWRNNSNHVGDNTGNVGGDDSGYVGGDGGNVEGDSGHSVEGDSGHAVDNTRDSMDNTRNATDYEFSTTGLFPSPMNEKIRNSSHGKKVLQLFHTLGMFVARSMLDSRIIDININPLFFRMALEKSIPSIGFVGCVDEQLAQSIESLIDMAKTNRQQIEHLALDFTLPGYPEIELVENGSKIGVDGDNVDEYIELIIDMTVGSGIQEQINSFCKGFSKVFPFTALKAFTPVELANICGQGDEDWSISVLLDSIKADHGYTKESQSIKDLVEIMNEFDMKDRRQFLQFMTGSPKLPIGGFQALNPSFTVVLKHQESQFGRDDFLPSVMTCANYLKLPNYSSKEVLKSRLYKAMYEGQGAFLLS